MARGITENDVWTASDALLLEGARPTIERVRQKIGRGSPNTVSPYLDTWFKRLGGRIKDSGAFSAPSDVPDPVQHAAKQVWDVALAETRRDFDQRLREGMAAAVSNVEAEKERAALAEAAAFEALSKVSHLQSELAARTGQLEQERLARAQVEAHFQDAISRVHDLQTSLERAELQTREVRESARRDVSEALDRSAAAERRALLAIEAERQARARAEKRADALDHKLEAAAGQARTTAAQQSSDLAARQQDRERLAVELAQSVGERDRLRAEIGLLHELLGAAQRLTEQATAEAVSVRSMFAQLDPKQSPTKARARPPRRSTAAATKPVQTPSGD